MIRLFTGLALPDRVREALLRTCTGLSGARWQRDDQLHLTLSFIGEVEEPVADDIVSALATIRSPAFDLTLSGTGTFGEKKRPRLLWAGVEPNPALEHLRAKGEAALARLGLQREGRKFHPHVTLARLERDVSGARLGEWLAQHADLWLPPFRVEAFHLYSSHLGQSGAIYTIEESFALEGGGAGGAADEGEGWDWEDEEGTGPGRLSAEP